MASVTKRNNTYQIRVSCGFDGNGRRITKSLTWIPDKGMTIKQAEREANRQAVLFEERCRTGLTLNNSTRFREFVEVWLNDHAGKQLRPTTVSGYKTMLRRILAAFGNMKVSAIQPSHLYAFYDNLAETGIRADIKYAPSIDFKVYLKKQGLTQAALSEKAMVSTYVIKSCTDGKNVTEKSASKISAALGKNLTDLFTPQDDIGLSNMTILHYHRLMSSILQSAVVTYQVILTNPCARTKAPKVKKKEARYLDEEGALALLIALDGEPYQYNVMIQTLLYTGMRRGELCGLEWSDIDFENCCLHIRRSSLYVPDRGIFEDRTKNDTSNRVIKVSYDLMKLLKQYKHWQDALRQEVGSKWKECGRLFTTALGNPIHPDTITGWFREFVERKDLPAACVHSLRHECVKPTLRFFSKNFLAWA